MKLTQKLTIATQSARLMLASRTTMRALRDTLRRMNEEGTIAFVADITDGLKPISVAQELQPFYDKYGVAMAMLLWSRPLRFPQPEFDELRYHMVRLRSTMRVCDLDLASQVRLDGGGSTHAKLYVQYLRQRFPGRTFGTAFEWCCGPAYIGFSLLAQGLCERLVLGDINPDSIALVKQTVEQNGLQDRVSYYVSDNLASVDARHRFDLVVGNPPWSYAKNDLYNELIANDPGWEIHRRFYSEVSDRMNPDGILCISEFKPHDTQARMEPNTREIWDTRPRVPHEEFLEMIDGAGLKHVETIAPKGRDGTAFGFGVWFIVSTRPAAGVAATPAAA